MFLKMYFHISSYTELTGVFNTWCLGLLLNGTWTLASGVAEKAEILNAFFASVFTGQPTGIPD